MTRTHDELQAAIWNDERGLPPGTREVALAMGWVLHKEPEYVPGRDYWKRVRNLLGHGCQGGRIIRYGAGHLGAGHIQAEYAKGKAARAAAKDGNRWR